MKRLAFLGVGSAIILGLGVMGASPAFADNGPHVSTSGNMSVDRCAGCHRVHTATNAYLLTQSETSLCQSCHGSGATGASSDVMDGVGYAITDLATSTRGATTGALRGGGFNFALIDAGNAQYATASYNRSIGVGASEASTSKHAIGTAGTMWGGGTNAVDGSGPSVTLECTSCHDPHGNTNYRILRPLADGGTAWTFPSPVSIVSITPNGSSVSEGRTTYYYDVVNSGTNTFKVTNPVTFYGTTSYDGLIGATVFGWTDATHFKVSSSTSISATDGAAGKVGFADPQAIAGVTAAAGVETFKTWNVHGLFVGQKVTITGIIGTDTGTTASTLNPAAQAVIASVPSTTTFTIANASATGAYVSGGKITGIPDAGGTKVYTTTNYWSQDDHNYTGSTVAVQTSTTTQTAALGGPTAFIANISQWCTQCHTRLLAGSGQWRDGNQSSDPMYMFEHRSNNGKQGSPNCIQCHVAHGSNASMLGDGTTAYSSQVQTEFGMNKVVPDSFLLRVDNRGTCQLCHNK